jgi:hypothetical protein
LNGRFASASHDHTGLVPVGGVIAWLKNLTGTPSIPSGFVECNGQTLSDAGSAYNGQVIPNLNASGGVTKRFLRGHTSSGGTGGTESHSHSLSSVTLSTSSQSAQAGTDVAALTSVTFTSGQATPTTELPPYYEVVWIIRVK